MQYNTIQLYNTIHKIQISVKAHLGDNEGKFLDVAEENVFEDEVFEY